MANRKITRREALQFGVGAATAAVAGSIPGVVGAGTDVESALLPARLPAQHARRVSRRGRRTLETETGPPPSERVSRA